MSRSSWDCQRLFDRLWLEQPAKPLPKHSDFDMLRFDFDSVDERL
jgi:hypothetical protein